MRVFPKGEGAKTGTVMPRNGPQEVLIQEIFFPGYSKAGAVAASQQAVTSAALKTS